MKTLHKIKRKMVWVTALALAFAVQWSMTVSAAELPDVSVSENAIPKEPEKSQEDGNEQENPDTQQPDNAGEEENKTEKSQAEENRPAEPENSHEETEQEAAEEPVNAYALQTINYKGRTLTDWASILKALETLTPEAVGADASAKTLVLQLQNVKDIPSGVKDAIAAGEGSDYTKVLQCNLGYGLSLVLNGSSDNSGFQGLSNASVTVDSEKRGKKSVATTVRFASHENLGTVAGLQLSLPRCGKGTKVSVYAETITTDANGNQVVGENVCIGTTKAGEGGNIEIPVQATANYMFVYKAAKE